MTFGFLRGVTSMKIYVRTIDFPVNSAQDISDKRKLVNQIEDCGFICSFVSGGIEVYAEKTESPWEVFKAMLKPEDI